MIYDLRFMQYLLDIFERRQNIRTILPYGYGMLEMSCRLFVPCPDRPSVGLLINMPFTQIDHRFDSDHHPFFQFYPLPLTAIIRHLRLFV